jgi:hypothetical protein
MAVLRRFGAARQVVCTALVALFLAGCGTAPYIDARREAGQTAPVGVSTPNMVAICYSKRGTTPEALQKLADSECAKTDRIARLTYEERWTCTMLTPRRIFYGCVAKP